MAVYTRLSAEELAALIEHYDVGTLIAAKGIAEGVSNSNWLIETSGRGADGRSRFILTMYERRIDLDDLPFFLDLLDYLAARGCPVPATMHDRSGASSRRIDDKAVALIEYLPGVSPGDPTPEQAFSLGRALAQMHLGARDFAGKRHNPLGASSWADTLTHCGAPALAAIDQNLPAMIDTARDLANRWPSGLPTSICHTDLFPDNVLMLGDQVTGLIDFYFACTEAMAYDLAVTHAAWSFADDGNSYRADIGRGLIDGYTAIRPLSGEETAALPILAQGASMRFLASRAADWIDTPTDALVTRKDPMDFARRLRFYEQHGAALFPMPA